MAKNAANDVMRHLRQMMLAGDKTSDGKLLGMFIQEHDEIAFEALVRRHGKMVLGVCRRVLANPHDAEDAFQSVFLVLARKANSIVPREMVGNWLYGVALQTAIRVRSMNAKQRGRERQVTVLPEPEVAYQQCRDDGTDMLDQELNRLPDKYRVVIVLCDLEGRTRKEVAKQLGWPEGSVSGRLARGKAMLAKRLAKRGLVLSGETVAVLLSQNAASAFLPPSLVSATVKAACIFATARTAAMSAKIVAITQGVLTSMLLTKLKTVTVVSFVCLLGLGLGGRFFASQTPGAFREKTERNPGIEANAQDLVDKQNNEKDAKTDSKAIEKQVYESTIEAINALVHKEFDPLIRKAFTVQAQRENAAKWEYKVESFGLMNESDATKKMNDLAAKGWEYVGLVNGGPAIQNSMLRPNVAFKRLKN